VGRSYEEVTLANDQLDAKILNTFFKILYMFQVISCSSSGIQIVLIQHLVSSLSVSYRPVHRTVTYLDASTNFLDVSMNCLDVSTNFLDVFTNFLDVSMNFLDVSTNLLDVSTKFLDVPRIVKNVQKISASSWSLAKVILRCTVSETSKLLINISRSTAI
jgi:hypothetical protein